MIVIERRLHNNPGMTHKRLNQKHIDYVSISMRFYLEADGLVKPGFPTAAAPLLSNDL